MKMKFNKKIALFFVLLTLAVQSVIITYNHFTGLISIDSFGELIFRILYGSFFSFFIVFPLVYFDLILINNLDKKFNWSSSLYKRIIIELLISILIASVPSLLVTVLVNAISPYQEGISVIIIKNILITAVINIIITAGLEVYNYFNNWQATKHKAMVLENELLSLKFESLKNQLNPHFLFNSLNVLASLIKKDAVAAEKFVEKFSDVYRYVLHTSDKYIVSLSEETAFCKLYLELQEYRFGRYLTYSFDIDSKYQDFYIPPLSVQLSVENAIKHNIINEDNPLKVNIFTKDECIFVVNDYNPKESGQSSKGYGIENIRKRYAYLSDKIPAFGINDNKFEVVLPLMLAD